MNAILKPTKAVRTLGQRALRKVLIRSEVICAQCQRGSGGLFGVEPIPKTRVIADAQRRGWVFDQCVALCSPACVKRYHITIRSQYLARGGKFKEWVK